MSKAFSARFNILGAGATGQPDEFDVFGTVVDQSLDGFSVADVQVDDLIFDENILNGQHTRYKVTSIVATGSGAFGGAGPNSIHCIAVFDDDGSAPVSGPAASSGAICKSSDLGIAEVPPFTIQGISEALQCRMRNIDMRKVVDPSIVDAGSGGSGGTPTSPFEKNMLNNTGSGIVAGTPVAKKPDGGIVPSKSDDATAKNYIGITKEAIANNAYGAVLMAWPNAVGVLNGLGFSTGANVYMSEVSGEFANAPGDFNDNNDRLVKVGIADCASDSASATATDLIMFTQVIGSF